MKPNHIPVLLAETIQVLAPQQGDRMLDLTLGLGGHSEALLNAVSGNASLVALDADVENIAMATERLKKFGSAVDVIHANFGNLPECLPQGKRMFDLILADLGLSSPHIDDPLRGFTFRADAPLDMRFDRSSGMTAAMLLASLDPERLRKIFWEYGELPKVRHLVDEIVRRRSESPVRTSKDLVDIAGLVYGYKASGILPQIFQALRIAVNREIEVLQHMLDSTPLLLAPGGRMAIISYHSLEDRMVKSAFRSLTADVKDFMTGSSLKVSAFQPLTKKAVTPSEEERLGNPRSRSALLRAIQRRTV